MELDLRWKRVGRNGDESNTGKREKMGKARTTAEPVRLSATSVESACAFFNARKREGEGQKDGGKAKKVSG